MDTKGQLNYVQAIGFFLLAVLLISGAILSLMSSQIPLLIVCVLLLPLNIYLIARGLKKGLRAPSRYEWFKYWMSLRPILFGLLGLALIWVFAVNGRAWLGDDVFESNPVMITMALAAILYFGLMIYFAIRAPYRSERDDAYKKRIGWKDLE